MVGLPCHTPFIFNALRQKALVIPAPSARLWFGGGDLQRTYPEKRH